MLQAHGFLDRDPALPLSNLLSQMEALLQRIPHPEGLPGWQFFVNCQDNAAANKFWLALKDKHFDPLWHRPETLSWCYQYFLEPGLKAFRSLHSPKIKEAHLALRTQQFTPRWIADFLVQNTLGRMWMQMHPDSQLSDHWPYLVPDPKNNDPPVELRLARDIKILDPACGTMNLGFSAIQVLEMIYREELLNAGKNGWPDESSVGHETQIKSTIMRHNLFGIDIDVLALELATLGFFIDSGGNLEPPNLYCGDSLRKSIFSKLQQKKFPTQYDVILLNPPYLDKRDYNPRLKSFMAKNFKLSGRNLYSAFLERSINFLTNQGRIGAVTPQTFMFIRSFEEFRRFVLSHSVVETLAHTGLNTFEDAVVDCAIYVLKRQDSQEKRENHLGEYLQLTSMNTSEEKNARLLKLIDDLHEQSQRSSGCYHYRQGDFDALPGAPWVYWISTGIRRLFSDLPDFASVAQFRQGLATTDNDRFVRYWWEIPSDQIAMNYQNVEHAATSNKKWFPYMKGGGYCKWYGMQKYLVNWGENGKEIKDEIIKRYSYLKGNWQWVAKNSEYYFREGVTYSYLTSGNFSARYSPPGSIFDVAGSSIFSDDPYQVLGILNSRWCRFALGLINHTVNFQVGDLQRLPAPREHSPELNQLVKRSIELSKRLETFDETSPDFIAPPPWLEGRQIIEGIYHELDDIQNHIDNEVYRLYGGLNEEDRNLIEHFTSRDNMCQTITSQQLAQRWISYAAGIILGRHLPQEVASRMDAAFPKIHTLVPDDAHGFAGDIRAALDLLTGPDCTQQIIESAANGSDLHPFLARDFFENHFQQYHQRPIYWLLKRKSDLFVTYYMNLNIETIEKFQSARQTPIQFNYDHGILKNMKLIKNALAVPAWRRYLD
jgi:hypothetical protein